MTDADAVIEQIASELEQPNLVDFLGIAAKRKRDREDAALRQRTRQEQRSELARWVRSFKADQGNSPLAFLREVQSGEDSRFAWGPDVASALAANLVTMTVEIDLTTHLPNCAQRFRFTLTKDGERRLQQMGEADEALNRSFGGEVVETAAQEA